MKPEPKPTGVICTVCDQPWDKHSQDRPSKNSKTAVTLDDCVRVLKAELARRPRLQTQMFGSMANFVPVPTRFGNAS